MYVWCMYVCMYVCMVYVCMVYVCMVCVCMYGVCMYVCMYICVYVCTCVDKYWIKVRSGYQSHEEHHQLSRLSCAANKLLRRSESLLET